MTPIHQLTTRIWTITLRVPGIQGGKFFNESVRPVPRERPSFGPSFDGNAGELSLYPEGGQGDEGTMRQRVH